MADHIQIGDVSPRVQYTADGVQTQFTYLFPIFEDADLEVYLDTSKQSSGYSTSGAGESGGGSVTFTVAPTNGQLVTLARRLSIQRTSDFQESGEFRSKVINDELDYLTASLQQVAEDQSRSPQMPVTESAAVNMDLPTPVADTTLVWNSAGDGFAIGPTVTEVSNAQTYANNAQASATASATSETNAAISATAAQTAAASNMYASNESKSADFSVAATDDGKQFLINTSAGNVTVTLPEGATATDGFRIALGKTTADNNAVIVNRTGTDTINGSTTWQFSSPHGQSVITLDATASPDTWFAAGLGVTAPVGVADLHENAKPYDIAFIAGFDDSMAAELITVQTYGELVMTRGGSFIGEAGYIDTASAGAAVIVDVEKNGTSIYTVAPQFAAAANTLTAGTLKTDGTEDFVSGDRITFKITQTGSSTAGSGLRFTIKGVLS